MQSTYTYVGNRRCRFCEQPAVHLWSYRASLRGRMRVFYLATCDAHQHAAAISAATMGRTLEYLSTKKKTEGR
jgi:hypothetical protein